MAMALRDPRSVRAFLELTLSLLFFFCPHFTDTGRGERGAHGEGTVEGSLSVRRKDEAVTVGITISASSDYYFACCNLHYLLGTWRLITSTTFYYYSTPIIIPRLLRHNLL